MQEKTKIPFSLLKELNEQYRSLIVGEVSSLTVHNCRMGFDETISFNEEDGCHLQDWKYSFTDESRPKNLSFEAYAILLVGWFGVWDKFSLEFEDFEIKAMAESYAHIMKEPNLALECSLEESSTLWEVVHAVDSVIQNSSTLDSIEIKELRSCITKLNSK